MEVNYINITNQHKSLTAIFLSNKLHIARYDNEKGCKIIGTDKKLKKSKTYQSDR